MFSGTSRITLTTIYAAGWLLYIIIPFLSIILNSSLSSGQYSDELSIIFFVSLASWCFGYLCYSSLCTTNDQSYLGTKSIQVAGEEQETTTIIGSLIAIAFVVALLTIQINYLFNGFSSFLSNSYGEFNSDKVNSLSSSSPLIIIGLILGAQQANKNTKFLKLLIRTLTVLISLLWIAGGLRNLTGMLLIGSFFIALRNRRIPNLFILSSLFLAVIMTAFIAVFRNESFLSILTGEVNVSRLIESSMDYAGRYLDGEFGTPYRVYLYLKEVSSHFEVAPMKSYLVDPWLHLIPTFIIPDRSPTLATQFTYAYFHSNIPPEGLGFSFINEAILNLGILFPIPIILFSLIIASLSKRLERSFSPSPHLLFLSSALAASSLNFFRIDFALFFKFSFIIYISARASYYICRAIKNECNI